MHKVLITGANRGLGEALCYAYEAAGSEVQRHCRIDDGRDCYSAGDLTKSGPINNMISGMRLDSTDMFVNNAAVKHDPMPPHQLGIGQFDKTIQLNIEGQLWILIEVYKYFVERGYGTIVNINSLYCLHPNPDEAMYGASKMAIKGFLQACSIDAKGTDVRILDVYLGATDTSMTAGRDKTMIDKEDAAKTIADISLMDPETLNISEIVLRNNTPG